ncbi:MAG: branched chain amino acid aminotransferase [Schleiferiaceae bacterium]
MIIHMISGPRNLSTATMYSFAQRRDTTVVDEPFYAHYLLKTGLNHPAREETLQSQSGDFKEVLQSVVFGDHPTEHLFVKNMAHHLIEADLSFLKDVTNVFLIRNPKSLIRSFAKVIPNPSLLEIGIAHERELYDQIASPKTVVLDATLLRKDPKSVLTKMCDQLGIEMDNRMLEWEAGPRPEDGVWAPHWYAGTHASTGFAPPVKEEFELPDMLNDLYLQAKPHYDYLYQFAIKP